MAYLGLLLSLGPYTQLGMAAAEVKVQVCLPDVERPIRVQREAVHYNSGLETLISLLKKNSSSKQKQKASFVDNFQKKSFYCWQKTGVFVPKSIDCICFVLFKHRNLSGARNFPDFAQLRFFAVENDSAISLKSELESLWLLGLLTNPAMVKGGLYNGFKPVIKYCFTVSNY